jgi:hypothetical protein
MPHGRVLLTWRHHMLRSVMAICLLGAIVCFGIAGCAKPEEKADKDTEPAFTPHPSPAAAPGTDAVAGMIGGKPIVKPTAAKPSQPAPSQPRPSAP